MEFGTQWSVYEDTETEIHRACVRRRHWLDFELCQLFSFSIACYQMRFLGPDCPKIASGHHWKMLQHSLDTLARFGERLQENKREKGRKGKGVKRKWGGRGGENLLPWLKGDRGPVASSRWLVPQRRACSTVLLIEFSVWQRLLARTHTFLRSS